MFEAITAAPPDAILGLTEAFCADERPDKVNLGVGVFKDADGKTPTLPSVHEAEKRLLRHESDKSYLPIPGSPEYGKLVQQLLFGADHPVIHQNRARTAHTPGGTGGLRIAADFIRKVVPAATVWISEPTWSNHPQILQAAGVAIQRYPYFDKQHNRLDFQAMRACLEQIPRGDVVLLHAGCHNPTGVDPIAEQWHQIANILSERKLLPLLDFAYQGFGDGLEFDAVGLRSVLDTGIDLLVANSFSKNFSLYNERVGGVTLVASHAQAADAAFSQLKLCIRSSYSNPPAHGGNIVASILDDPALRQQWIQEVQQMRHRINGTRQDLVAALKRHGLSHVDFIAEQRGMFTVLNLGPQQIQALRDDHGIYAVNSGRINVAGITPENLEKVAAALAAVSR